MRSAKISFYIPTDAQAMPDRLRLTHWDFYYTGADEAPASLSTGRKTTGLLSRLRELFGFTLRGSLMSEMSISARQLVDETIANPGDPIHPALHEP